MDGGGGGGSTDWSRLRRGLPVVLWAVAFVGLALIERRNFLLFHGLAEVFSIVIASAVFIVAWNSRGRMETDFLLIVGVAYAVVAALDTLHTFAYVGMGVFPDTDANLSTQLWLAARYVEAGSLAVASLFVGETPLSRRVSFGYRRRGTALLVGGYLAVGATLVAAIFGGWFPVTYVPGSGLTAFKVYSEYVIVGLLAVALGQLYRHRHDLERRVYWYLAAGTLLTIASELFFTVYVSVYGFSNVVGHFLKIASFYLIYLAVVKTAISNPQDVLFRQLQQERDRLADREAELARKNRRLDRFASMVSHDLRNPLNVAAGRLELARNGEGGDDPHLDRVETAHARMEALIDDVLALARDGRTVDETRPIELAPLARRCWQAVGTDAAELRVETDDTVLADEPRLGRVFENLFRNAVEHGGDDVVVTVGSLSGGFYVADDGPGVPADEREAVFEAGYSTAVDGTGFGLNIVAEIAAAHGWSVAVTETADGGARFEVTGVETPESDRPVEADG